MYVLCMQVHGVAFISVCEYWWAERCLRSAFGEHDAVKKSSVIASRGLRHVLRAIAFVIWSPFAAMVNATAEGAGDASCWGVRRMCLASLVQSCTWTPLPCHSYMYGLCIQILACGARKRGAEFVLAVATSSDVELNAGKRRMENSFLRLQVAWLRTLDM
ncbi:hypothetical protein T440DRAFT_184001 [Plenodomus tracheiphilus IPT5]|uniref:Uncharacterized protein n=1 Tax=Plenodomus tracheiphilus IPT5 TaxID=1408161 RepID=A0A6A7AXN6_9PLEO|nr:hypothetical protein T440DRAFT_184001 [Plenodomus tracheiphilus IPT5]